MHDAIPVGHPTPPSHTAAVGITATVVTGAPIGTTRDNYVGWTIDSSANRGFFRRDLNPATGGWLAQRAAYLASQLSAAQPGGSLLRFGGAGSDALTYLSNVPGVKGGPCGGGEGDVLLGAAAGAGDGGAAAAHCLSAAAWKDLAAFTRAAGAQMVFAFNLLQPPSTVYAWNSENARAFVNFVAKSGDADLIYGYELGNEEDGLYSAQQQALSFSALYFGVVHGARMIGPDPRSIAACPGAGCSAAIAYIQEFIHWCGVYAVPLTAVTHHEFIGVGGTSSPASFLDPTTLDMTASIASSVASALGTAGPEIWAGEIGPAVAGSPPCDHSSMRWANFGDSLCTFPD